MDDILIQAIRIIEGIKNNSFNFYRAHLFTTENISGFSKKISFQDKTILTVCSSGDQAFNMLLNGASEINLFDIDIFTKYYFFLKKAAIQCLTYKEFLNFLIPKNIFNNNILSFNSYLNIRDYIIDEEIQAFWDYLFCHYSSKTIYESNLFVRNNINKKSITNRNDYLQSETYYNILKNNLKNKTFNFYNLNLFNEQFPQNQKYDFIYLSNIFDYLNVDDKLKYAKKIKDIVLNLKEILTNDGLIAVSYLYFYFDEYLGEINNKNLSSLKIRDELFKEFYYIIFPGVSAPLSRQLRNKDALMLYKNNC